MGWISADKLCALQVLVKDIVAESVSSNAEPILPERISIVKSELKRRRLREKIFPSAEFFSDPAWDILLELFAADQDGVRLSVSSIGVESEISPSTVVRWLSFLERHNLVERFADANDKRRQWIGLTQTARNLMIEYFS